MTFFSFIEVRIKRMKISKNPMVRGDGVEKFNQKFNHKTIETCRQRIIVLLLLDIIDKISEVHAELKYLLSRSLKK